MRLDDICIVNTDVTASDDFYRESLGLERRMRNVRFADFVFAEGPRLAMWQRASIAETVGASFPTEPGLPFRVTLELADAAAVDAVASRVGNAVRIQGVAPRYAVSDPDGFVTVIAESSAHRPRIAEIELTVRDPARTFDFLERLGFAPVEAAGRMRFDGGGVAITILDAAAVPREGSAQSDLASFTRNGAHVMLAVELDSGDRVDEVYAELKARGLADSGPPALYEWGARAAYFVDPDGYIWEIYAFVEDPR